MAAGRKTGGRKPGTPNRRTAEVAERLRELDCDPIEGMARIAKNRRAPIDVRARMFAELAQYVAPKRKAVELAAEISSDFQPRVVEVVGVYLPHNGREPRQAVQREPPPREQNNGAQHVQDDPASRVPTVRVRSPDGRVRIINASDFDPQRHVLADEADARASGMRGFSVVGL